MDEHKTRPPYFSKSLKDLALHFNVYIDFETEINPKKNAQKSQEHIWERSQSSFNRSQLPDGMTLEGSEHP